MLFIVRNWLYNKVEKTMSLAGELKRIILLSTEGVCLFQVSEFSFVSYGIPVLGRGKISHGDKLTMWVQEIATIGHIIISSQCHLIIYYNLIANVFSECEQQ